MRGEENSEKQVIWGLGPRVHAGERGVREKNPQA